MRQTVIILNILVLLACNQSAKQSENKKEQVLPTTEKERIDENDFSAELFQSILQQLQIKSDDCYLPFVVENNFNGLSCWVVPTMISMEAKEPHSFSLACYVLLADRKTEKIVSKYYHPHAWDSSDAWRLTNISINDTPYQSDKNIDVSIYSDKNMNQSNNNVIKVFSVIAHYEDSSRVSPVSREEISFFIPQDKSLKKIFDYTTNAYGENNCNGYDEIDKRLFISDNMTNGLYDIVMAIDSINIWFSDDDPDLFWRDYTTDYKFFHYTGDKYEETTKLNHTVVHIKRFHNPGPASPIGIEIYYYFGKTLAQAYDILKENYEYLKSELPKENIEYSIAGAGCCLDTDLVINYKCGRNTLSICIFDGHLGINIDIIEKEGYTLVSSIWSD